METLKKFAGDENAQNLMWALAFVVVAVLVAMGKLKPETLEGLLFGLVARSSLKKKD